MASEALGSVEDRTPLSGAQLRELLGEEGFQALMAWDRLNGHQPIHIPLESPLELDAADASLSVELPLAPQQALEASEASRVGRAPIPRLAERQGVSVRGAMDNFLSSYWADQRSHRGRSGDTWSRLQELQRAMEQGSIDGRLRTLLDAVVSASYVVDDIKRAQAINRAVYNLEQWRLDEVFRAA